MLTQQEIEEWDVDDIFGDWERRETALLAEIIEAKTQRAESALRAKALEHQRNELLLTLKSIAAITDGDTKAMARAAIAKIEGVV